MSKSAQQSKNTQLYRKAAEKAINRIRTEMYPNGGFAMMPDKIADRVIAELADARAEGGDR